MMPGPEVADPVAARAIAERRELMRRCAQSIVSDHQCGRNYADRHTLDWAQLVVATTPALNSPLTEGAPRT